MPSEKAKQPEEHVSGQSNRPMTRPAHCLTLAEVLDELQADSTSGLSGDEASRRLAECGKNDLGEAQKVSPIRILVAQVANAMTLVLILAMAVSFGIKSWIEGGVVAGVILLNIVVGFFQEYSAAKTIDSLRSLSSPTANVIRDGQSQTVASSDLVPGDLVELKTGDTIPADVRVFDAVNFETDEALLTGESLPVRKKEDTTFEVTTGPGDRLNVAYSSSNVTKGRAKGIVFSTGAYTEIGAIAAQLRQKETKIREPKKTRKDPDARPKPHRYLEAYLLTVTDAAGRFLGLNVGTPLQRKLSKLAVLLFFVAVVCAIIVLGANEFRTTQDVIIYAVATGLSMIPASLVVVLTITMAAGTKRMVKRNVVVRNLKSLEALGAVTDICSDKTGTLTQGKMIARGAWIPSEGTFTVENSTSAVDPTSGHVRFHTSAPRAIDLKKAGEACGDIIEPADYASSRDADSGLSDFFNVACLANLATVSKTKEGEWEARGDPTEIAIQVMASRFGWNRVALTGDEESEWRDVAELPFDSDVKRMSVVMRNKNGSHHAFTKGAVERVLDSCTTYVPDGSGTLVDIRGFHTEILENMQALASLGLRVLALASKPVHGEVEVDAEGAVDRTALECGLVFRGLVGLYDPPRPESAPAVRQCHEAGIEVHMLTGDHPETAKAIAVEVGILPSKMHLVASDVASSMVMTATQFDALGDDAIDELPVLPLVIARCAPSTKVRMIEALHRRGRFCAMTGDGVNDSPSLRRADVGIAMGVAGSDVAKDASDIVLSDDNFASILAAIEEGRRIFDNIQKFVLHVLAENVAQAGTLLVGLAFKDRTGLSVFPLAPVQVVWIIMATSGLPDMGLGFERAVPDILQRPPRSLRAGIFTVEFLVDMVFYGLWITLLCLASFVLVVHGFGNGELGELCNETYSPSCDVVFRARATTFACLTWFALFLAWEMIDVRRSFFRMQPGSRRYFTQWALDIWRNRFLFWAVIVGFVTLFPLIYIPVLNTEVFKHKPISWEWGIVFVTAGLFFAGAETWKFGKRVYFRRQDSKRLGKSWRETDIEDRVFGQYFSGSLSAGGTTMERTTEKATE
ncbi:Sodium transport ATPase 5 [Colletotrichum spinosum]|uniref:P-type Na(+) transporter n=1 Tax=Colletotrichum spinosum TaxID=1347390 RepID=A0A4R8QCR5_9PEZI|nr:Sodium transport ATPase 5 [Colletotrichum spinosum]